MMTRSPFTILRRSFAVVLACLAVPSPAHAEAGVSMLAVGFPVFLILFLPIVLLQTFYLWHKVGISFRLLLRRVGYSDVVALLLGFPAAWLFILILQETASEISLGLGATYYPPFTPVTFPQQIAAVAMTSAWLFPGAGAYGWPLLLAFLILLVPTCIIAHYSQWLILRTRRWPDASRARLRGLLFRSSLISFAVLLLAGPLIVFWFA